MSLIQAIVLGLVQGLTEFIPVSSSGHLTLVPFILGWHEPTVAFDVALHFGTLVAVTYVFRGRVMQLVRTVIGWRDASERERRLLTLVAIATLPAALVGFLLNDAISRVFESPVRVALFLGVTGYFLLSSETAAAHREHAPREDDDLVTNDAVAIGIAQAIAILPGISRSGSTIGTGMRLGLSREAAARFSFLMSIPIIAGAILAELPDMLHQGFAGSGPAFVIGIVVSGIAGFASITWFLSLLTRRGLRPFGVYCMLAMIAGLITALARG